MVFAYNYGMKRSTNKRSNEMSIEEMFTEETVYTTDCCDAYCESDTQICPECHEHCTVECEVYDVANALADAWVNSKFV